MNVAKTAPDALKILWKEKIFLKPKDVKAIESELEKRGYNFAAAGLMMALQRSKFLTRKGDRGKYTYVQRHPFVEADENDE
jgi:repressor of nif and glnA expression